MKAKTMTGVALALAACRLGWAAFERDLQPLAKELRPRGVTASTG